MDTQIKYTDDTVMQTGKWEGTKLANIPASWFLWIWEQPWFKTSTRPDHVALREYIKENWEALNSENA